MTIQFTRAPRRQHDCRESAERAIEIFYPAGYFYEIAPVCIRGGLTFAVKAYGKDDAFLGYCYSSEEEGQLCN